jgi:hypothetical protein
MCVHLGRFMGSVLRRGGGNFVEEGGEAGAPHRTFLIIMA